MKFDWSSSSSQVLINPAYSEVEKRRFNSILEFASNWTSHFWIATSGSTVVKWVGLSKQAILSSAAAVNSHLESHSKDVWVHTLPDFHVGGIGIWARAYLSGASVCDFKIKGRWDPIAFHQYVEQMNGTLTALVPAQIHDLVRLKLRAPHSLRALIIGGGVLTEELYRQAIDLKWKVLPSYGMTECASQIATAVLGSWEQHLYPSLQILAHLQAQTTAEGRLGVRGESLLSCYAWEKEGSWKIEDPKQEGWFWTEDRGKVKGNSLAVLGRLDQVVKVGGENVDLARLEKLLQDLKLLIDLQGEVALVAYPDERLGHVLHLAVSQISEDDLQPLLDQFHQRVLPFEKIRHIHFLPLIPKSPLSKVLRQDLLTLIQKG